VSRRLGTDRKTFTMPTSDTASLLIPRRRVLALPWAALLGGPLARAASARPADGSEGRFVLVFLRGAADTLSIVVPHADPHYAQLRRSTAIPAPDGTDQTALPLDTTFGLHPALAPLWPLWQRQQLAVVPCAGLPQAVRSHFEAQHRWETGQPDLHRAADGWLNTWARLQAGAPGSTRALGVGESNPEILRGRAPVQLVQRGRGALNTGSLKRDHTRQALLDLYADDPQLGPVFAQGTRSRIETARTLTQAQTMTNGMASPEAVAADNGAMPPTGLALDARHLATLMQNDPQLRVGFLSAGGWDTHANQGGVSGSLAQSLKGLAPALLELQRSFNRPNDVVAVVSEFGRTAAENGTQGTDHGHGTSLLLMGPRVQGGRWHGRWEGLAPGQLNEGRDLPVFHDFRAVLSLLLRGTQGASDAQLEAVFPGNPYAGSALTSGDNRRLSGLLRG
jgi:uncharacterized protein (DUF1501 family)